MSEENETLEPELPPSDFYFIRAIDSTGYIASQGIIAAEKVRRARRRFLEEGWTVTVVPIDHVPDTKESGS